MEDSPSDSKVFSVRIVSLDYYMAPPIPGLDICYSSFQGGKVNEVPVIRIYGSTPAGQKTCLHVHRALPYLYVPCSELQLQPEQEGDACTHVISSAIEKALKLKGNAGSKRQHVHGCSLVQARKFYGYHSLEELFLKIYLYYPQDVSRAAKLLLGGAVLDKILQPHESHIPFLLQFLVDYDLYGMGHLHVAKMMFRHPIPDVFTPRKANYNGQCRQQADNSPCLSADYKDSSGDACLSSPIWMSSTIPDSWIWQYPSQPDPSTDPDIHLVKRQSTCELEGDAVVDEILNQHFKLYSSFSQTRSDVKMVRSLIPIWEEFERTGIHLAAIPPDPGKPLPVDVLRTLSYVLGVENELMDLCGDAGNSSSSTPLGNGTMSQQLIRSSTDEVNLVELGCVDPENNSREPLKWLKESEEIGFLLPQVSTFQDDDGANLGEARDGCLKQLLSDELQISNTTGKFDTKGADQEALRLLKWLASSQAAEDINSDDELVHETILSPLLPATTINKVLEKANMDYESESQQECQDILDSVEDFINFEGLRGRASHSVDHSHSCQTPSEKTIPQVDGSGDDQHSIPCAGKSSKMKANSEYKKSLPDQGQHDAGSSFTNMHKRKRSLRGSLPVSSTQKLNDDLQPVSFNMTGRCDSLGKDSIGFSCLGNEEDRCLDALRGVANRDGLCAKEESTITGCSVRDLMRRKRYFRVEPQECETSPVKKVLSAEEGKEESFSHIKCSDGQHTRFHDSSISGSSLNDEQTEFHERKMLLETYALGVSGEACDAKPSNSICSTYGNLPAFSSSENSLLANTNEDVHFRSCEGLKCEIVTGATAGSGKFRITSSPSLYRGTKESPEFLNSENQNSAINTGQCENCDCEELDSSLNCIRHLTSDMLAGKPDPCLSLKFDTDNKLSGEEKLLQTDAAGSSCLAYPVEGEIFDKGCCISQSVHKRKIFMQIVSKKSSDNCVGMEVAAGITLMQSEKLCTGHHVRDCGLSGPHSLASTTVNMESNTGELVGMTLCKKPPKLEPTDGTFSNASLSPNIPHHPCHGDEENCEPASVQDRFMGNYLPFFLGDCLEDKEVQEISCGMNDVNYRQEAVIGVPIHFQNDGSFLYMLTPVFSPPSTDSVHRWLLLDGTDIFRETINEAPAESSSPNGSNLVDSQGSPTDTCVVHFLDSCSIPDAKPNLDQLNQQNQGNGEMKPFHDNITTVLQTEEDIMKMKHSTGCSQDFSQISGPDVKSKVTPLSQIGFRDPASVGGGQQLTLLSIEVQAESRGDLRPDPRFDAIDIIVLVIQEDDDSVLDAYVLLRSNTGYVRRNLDGMSSCKVLVSSEEKHLFNHFTKIICSFDPDILMGWDMQGGSLGFLAERAAHLGIGLLDKISRMPSKTNVASKVLDASEKGLLNDVLPEPAFAESVLEDAIIEDEWGRTHASGVHVGGRVVLNIWRMMRSEVKLNMYTVEAVAEAVLRRKIPSFHCKVLTKWFSSGPGQARYRCIEYVLERAKLNLQIMNQLDLINRTSELARVFGIDFFSVLSRGSQYRVESMFLRLAHTQNYLVISPGNQQVASQPAMECLPLVMEPESGFYSDPVVVLDFQSLYPSMIIAYNLCFCTCLGKVKPSKSNTLGVSSYSPDLSALQGLKHEILLTPNGVMYVPSKVRKGVLPRLLEEILSTRIMVKQAMKKLAPSQKVLQRIFNARQLALKLIANVTYGYTAAGFSGRMPCAELADSIVQCGRRTLENAISFVNTHDKWKARVIYGDTDSMFVLLKGRSVKESFQIGHEIASAVTAMNPNPVALKMEKVYHPCFLLTKKRYVGYSYESPAQIKPMFDAKGIETVRRDTCGAVSKTMEQSLRLFFEHQDINKVKAYLLRQWTRILSGRISLQDFVFAKEVRLGTYSRQASSLPPAAIVSTKAMRADPRAEPRYAERIPYIVVHGEPGARLVDMVVDPLDLLATDSPFRLNDIYYISKQIIPALQRVFGLVGVDLNQWFSDMPRPGREAVGKHHFYAPNIHRTRIDYYYLSKHCILCGELVQSSTHVCGKCSKNGATVATAVIGKTSKLERDIQHLAAVCQHCGGGDRLLESGVKCTSLACSVFYERRKVQKELQSLSAVAADAGFYPRCMVEWF